MKKNLKFISILLCFIMLLSIPCSLLADNKPQIKNIIFMIPDGGGMAPYIMASMVKNAGGFNEGIFPNATPTEKGNMAIEPYFVGAETTYCNDNAVTDSAAAGTALSTGYKTNKTFLGVNPDGVPRANILEASQRMGKNTGMVVTFEWTNATPAAFSAHDISRYSMRGMSEQIVNQDIDVVFGSTHTDFADAEWFTDEALTQRGYDIITSKDDLKNVKPGDRMWGKFPELLYFDTVKGEKIPSLAEMTQAAITALDDGNENGFFLMVEGSTVDLAGHNSDGVNIVGELLAFDKACRVAIDFAKKRTDTLVVIMPDHDTGGMTWTEGKQDAIVSDIQKGTNPADASWEGNGSHTARDGGIFMYVPQGVSYPDGIDPAKASITMQEFISSGYRKATTNLIDNTEIAPYLASFMGIDLDSLSKDLFVDVTDLGTYNSTTEVFTFNDYDGMTIKRNTSTAAYKGNEIDLNGEIALCIEGKFYVPRLLLDTVENKIKPDALGDMSFTANYTDNTITLSGNMAIPAGHIDLSAKSADGYSEFVSATADANAKYSIQLKPSDIEGNYILNMDFSKSPKTGVEIPLFAPALYIPDLSVIKNSSEVTSAAQLFNKDVVTVKLTGFDPRDGFNGLMIIAQYDADGKLINVTSLNADADTADAEISTKLSISAKPSRLSVVYNADTRYGNITGSYILK